MASRHAMAPVDARGARTKSGIGKSVGVRLGALKIGKTDGKIAITFPAATKEMLAAVGAYERSGGAAKK